jgi:hypothetical protein
MACAAMGMWIRSRVVCDVLFVNMAQRSYRFGSGAGLLYVLMSNHEDELPGYIIESHDIRTIGDFSIDKLGVQKFDPLTGIEEWRWEWAGFRRSEGHDQLRWMRVDTIPYWFPAISLTLLSTYLILWPGKRVKSAIQTGPPRPFSN